MFNLVATRAIFYTRKTENSHLKGFWLSIIIIISQNANVDKREEAPTTADVHLSGFKVAGLIALEGKGNEPNNNHEDWVSKNFWLVF